MRSPFLLTVAVAAVLIGGSVPPALAGSHLWVINEIFSNVDGTVQFIEMHVPVDAANETNIGGKWVESATTGNQYVFPGNLPPGSTAFAYLLLATEAFADLEGAPTPDHIIPSNFFDLDTDTIRWWAYGNGDLSFSSGELPLDGIMSLNRDGSTGINSPTNFNGETGSVDAGASAVPGEDPTGREAAFSLRVLAEQPSQGSIDLEFQLPQPAEARLNIFDTRGRLIRRLFEERTQGTVRLTWDGTDQAGQVLASGVYLIQLESDGRRAVRKALLIR
jgi:hypothetical protein